MEAELAGSVHMSGRNVNRGLVELLKLVEFQGEVLYKEG